MFDTFRTTSVSSSKVSSASETRKNLHNSDFITCRGLPATWSDPIVELPHRTRGLPFHLWTEVLPANSRMTASASGKPPARPTMMPIGTRLSVLAENVSEDDLPGGYIPWAQLKAVHAGLLELKDVLPATACELKTAAWQLADTFVMMRDHATAEFCIQNAALATSAARRAMAGSYFPPVPAVFPPSIEAWHDANLLKGSSCPSTSFTHFEDWALIAMPAEPLPRAGTMIGIVDILLMEEEKPAVRFPRPRRFMFGVVASTVEGLVR